MKRWLIISVLIPQSGSVGTLTKRIVPLPHRPVITSSTPLTFSVASSWKMEKRSSVYSPFWQRLTRSTSALLYLKPDQKIRSTTSTSAFVIRRTSSVGYRTSELGSRQPARAQRLANQGQSVRSWGSVQYHHRRGPKKRAKPMPSYKAAKSSRPLTSPVIYSAGLWMRRNSFHVTEPQIRPTRDRLCDCGNACL